MRYVIPYKSRKIRRNKNFVWHRRAENLTHEIFLQRKNRTTLILRSDYWHAILLPLLRNNEHDREILRGKWPMITPSFLVATARTTAYLLVHCLALSYTPNPLQSLHPKWSCTHERCCFYRTHSLFKRAWKTRDQNLYYYYSNQYRTGSEIPTIYRGKKRYRTYITLK